MEANFGGENHQFFAAGSSKRYGKKALEWDLNDWKWDGDLFMATPVDRGPLNCLNKQLFPDIVLSNSSSSCSDETEFGVVGKVLGEADKRRRIVAVEDDEQCDDTRSLTLKLGAHSYPVMEDDLNFVGMKNGKRGVVQASNSNHPKCQVENCGADLSQTKDYHRRHKVCEMHAKASSAVVGNVIQRFCQQCSRFHLLQEFDEGKRSCRRRLAGHNRRRRKTLSDATTPNESSAAGDQSAGYLLISLLRILANLNSDRSEQPKDQEFLSNLLRNIASLAGSSDGNNSSGLLQASQDLQKAGTSVGTAGEASNALISGAVPAKENVNSLCSPAKTVFDPAAAANHCASPAVTDCVSPAVAPREIHGHQNLSVASFDTTVQATCSERLMLEKNGSLDKSRTLCSLQHMLPTALTDAGVRKKGFDLNTVYYEEEDGAGGGQPANQATLDIGSSNCPSWILQDSHQSSPPQTSGNTDSTSNRSPSSSNGDAQSRTDRIVFKLFGKDPNDFPLVLRAQIFDWLSNSPTDMESYIRPGCIILTVYLRLEVSMWDELCLDLGSSLKRLLFLSDDDFWRMGWIYARVQHHIAFIYNGQVVLNKSLIMERPICSKIVSVTPIAVPPSSRVTFKVKGSNLVRSTSRLLCAFEGKYLSQEINQPTVQYSDSRNNGNRNEQLQSLSFSCYVPDAIGRGFIEIEDNGLSSGFFPFIVAEEDICAEIKMLESSMNLASSEDLSEEKMEAVRTLGMNFLHEMGWLLRQTQLRSSSESENSCLGTFSLLRFRWILRFAIDHDWSAIVKRFLDILFEGNIETDGRFPNEIALSEDLLHYAVQRNSNSTVKLLLRYKPDKISDGGLNNLFRPDMPGPSGITPLHVAATSSFAESMLNILTDDPAQFGQAIEPSESPSVVDDDAVIYGRNDDGKKLLLSDDCMELDISLIQITGETTSKVGDAVIYGREDDKKKVIQLLLSDDCKEHHISLIQITGAGGIGKSTLAYLVYNDSMICDYFDIKAWVHMPEVIDVGGILKAVIESLTGISCYVTELNELVQIIEEELSGKRFLIVLDHVRNGTQDFWDSFMVSLSIGAKGSIVMVTAQTEIISDLMGSIRPYHLNSLSDDHCFSIFLECAFDKQDPCIFPELVRTGKHIAAKCEGVPLAAKAVGGLLHFNENNFPADSQYWKDVLESVLWGSDDFFPALSLCYDYLPMHLKLCFRYCSLFPEGYIFEKDHLIRLWMSQGYLESTDGDAAEEIGINCIEELLRRSFFQCLHIYDARERKYGIHDLFHKFAKRVAVECFRIEDSIPENENIPHLSLVPCAVEALVSNLYKQQSDHLRTILFIPRSAPKWQGSAVHIKNIRLLNDLFIKFRYLRSLDLSNTDIKELPDSIENLQSLCYLSLNNTNIRRLPKKICSLGSLQTLELQDCYFLSDLPPNIKELTKLRCLNVSKESGFISMPSGIGELRNLRTLSNFNVGKVRLNCEIVELQNLLDLRGNLCIAGLENVVSGDQANQANLKMKGCLKTLTLHWFENGWESEAETEENALDVIQYLQPHTNLEELIIHNYFGSQFPTWLGDPLFCNLVSVTLDNCYESNVLPPLGQLPSLRFLSLQKMDNVRTLGLEFCGSSSEVPCAFPSLEILKLWEMSALEEWNLVQDGNYPKLRSLSISMCFKLKQLPPLNFLRELVFHCCDRLPEIPRLNSLEYLKTDSCPKLEFISLPHDLPALKKLEINNCGRLSLVDGWNQLASGVQFKAHGCPKLNL